MLFGDGKCVGGFAAGEGGGSMRCDLTKSGVRFEKSRSRSIDASESGADRFPVGNTAMQNSLKTPEQRDQRCAEDHDHG